MNSSVATTTHNRILALVARSQFLYLLLYDKDISQYPGEEVLNAYNQSVSMVPGAADSPEILRNLMLRNLQTAYK